MEVASDQLLIDEHRVGEFRCAVLSAENMYSSLPDDDGVLLVNVPPGIGKSYAARGLIGYALSQQHDLVIYVAPTRAIINELTIPPELNEIEFIVLEPRPRKMCGPLNEQWSELEQQSCAALAKVQLCGECHHNAETGGRCEWPNQMDRIDTSIRLVVMTEQYLVLNPSLLQQIKTRVGPSKTLVVFDEGLFMTGVTKQQFDLGQVRLFKSALQTTTGLPKNVVKYVKNWVVGIDFLLDDEVPLENLDRFFTGPIKDGLIKIQATGVRSFNSKFYYPAYDMALLNSPIAASQWRDADQIEIIKKVDTTDCDAIILSAYLGAQVVEERLQRPVIRLVESTVFRHSETTFMNIIDPVGSAHRMSSSAHLNRVVDFFFALILRNIQIDRRTVLVCRKKFISRISNRITTLAKHIDANVNCVCPAEKTDYTKCSVNDVVLINYGIIGINSLQEFDALYCVGGYYCDAAHLNEVYQQTLPPEYRFEIGINTENQSRTIVAADGKFHSRFHAKRAAATFNILERSVVLQAVGRVRPFTTPAEVILFQCDDYSTDLGEVQVFNGLPTARSQMNIPTGKELSKSHIGERVRELLGTGSSLRATANVLGVATSTAGLARAAPVINQLLKQINTGGRT